MVTRKLVSSLMPNLDKAPTIMVPTANAGRADVMSTFAMSPGSTDMYPKSHVMQFSTLPFSSVHGELRTMVEWVLKGSVSSRMDDHQK